MRRLSSVVCVLALALAPAAALGAPPKASDREAARALADKGAELFEAGRYEESIDLFSQANERVKAPTFMLAIAQAYVKLGKLIEAAESFQKVIDEPLPPAAPQSFVEAQAAAKRELEGLATRIPTLQIVVTGAPAGAVKVSIDGEPVASIEQPIAQNPGDHTVVVEPTSGGPPITRSVSLREGATERVEIAVEAPSGSSGGSGSGDFQTTILPAAIALGVGAVGLGIGAVTGGIALGKVGDIKDQCPNNVCPRGLEGDVSSAGTLADVSTVGFIIGGVGVAAGVALFVLRPFEKSPSKPAAEARRPFFQGVQASLGPGSVRVTGRF